MPNFKIIPTETDFQIIPLTAIAGSLIKHCHNHGMDMLYPTQAGAESAIARMDRAIENRNGKPWQAFK